MSESNQVTFRYIPEVNGVTPVDDAGWLTMAYAGNMQLSSRPLYFESQQMVGGSVSRVPSARVKVGRETSGTWPFEFSAQNLDDMLEAALCGTWTANVLNVGSTDRSFTIECEYLDVAHRARGLHTFTQQPADTETITIDSKVYTFQTTLTDSDGNVKIGATLADSIDNLIAAINLGAGSGTTYAASMTVHPTAYGETWTADVLRAIAKTGGTAGNSIATTTTITGGSWGAATMEEGAATTIMHAKGVRVAQMAILNAAPGQPVTGSVTFAGASAVVDSGTSLVGAGSETGIQTNRVLRASDFSAITFAGRPIVTSEFIISNLTAALNNQMTPLLGLGQDDPFDQKKGRCVVTGNIRAYLGEATYDIYERANGAIPTQLGFTMGADGYTYAFNYPELSLEGDNPGSPGIDQQVEVEADYYMQESGLVITRATP